VYERHLIKRLVIPSDARDLQFAAKCRSLASLGMTKSNGVEERGLTFAMGC
jgi:hypothetical protein